MKRFLPIALLFAAPALAQDQGNARRFAASPVLSPYLTVDGSHTHGNNGFALSLITTFESAPLVYIRDGERTAEIVGDRLTLDLTAAYGILEWLDVGIAFPLVLVQDGRTADDRDALSGFSFGDPGLAVKAEFLDKHVYGFGGAVLVGASLPFGDASSYAGEPNVTVTPRLALEVPIGARFDVAVNGGYRVREKTSIGDVLLDDEILLGLGASYRVLPPLELVTEVNASARAEDPFAREEESPVDLNLGVRWAFWEDLRLMGGGGFGLNPGYGSPGYRAFLGLELVPRRHDFDGDRVADGRDDCVEVPGVPTHAGCPAPAKRVAKRGPPPDDEDADGVPDALDRCPLLPEDVDGFRDDDGCPDADNDLDFLADVYDADPMAPEDWDGHDDADGIPDLDNDADGVADFRDGCPNEPGGADGCPGSAPLQPESVAASGSAGLARGVGPNAPLVLGDTIHPTSPILFEFAKPALTEEAKPLVDGLAEYLNAHPGLGKIEVGVHVDRMGSRRWKHWLSRQRAKTVTAALVERGVPRKRLVPRGYGPEVPVATNKTKEGRFKNRRVELRVMRPKVEKLPARKAAPAPRKEAPPPAQPAPAPDRETPTGLPAPRDRWLPADALVVRSPEPIEFEPRGDALTAKGRRQVATLAETLKTWPDRRFEVGVHTDGLGDMAIKEELTWRRAHTVAEALVAAGVDEARLKAVGYGATRRLAADTDRAGRERNRRVELRALGEGMSMGANR